MRCPACGKLPCFRGEETGEFQLGELPPIKIKEIVFRCVNCNEAWTGWETELLREAAYRECLLRERVRQVETRSREALRRLGAFLDDALVTLSEGNWVQSDDVLAARHELKTLKSSHRRPESYPFWHRCSCGAPVGDLEPGRTEPCIDCEGK